MQETQKMRHCFAAKEYFLLTIFGTKMIIMASTAMFSVILREWRKQNGKKISVAAQELGVSVSSWGHWETGERVPSLQNMELISQYTGIPLNCLLCSQYLQCNRAPGPFP